MKEFQILVCDLDFDPGSAPAGWAASVWEIDGATWTCRWRALGFGSEVEARQAAEEWVGRRRGDG